MWAPDDIVHANMLFYPLYYDIISVKSLKITQAFHLLLDYAENQGVFLDFKMQNSVQITKGSDNGDSYNQGSTVLLFLNDSVYGYKTSTYHTLHIVCNSPNDSSSFIKFNSYT